MVTTECTPGRNANQPSVVEADAAVDRALLPLIRINGILCVVPNTLHFYYPAVPERPAKPKGDREPHRGKDKTCE